MSQPKEKVIGTSPNKKDKGSTVLASGVFFIVIILVCSTVAFLAFRNRTPDSTEDNSDSPVASDKLGNTGKLAYIQRNSSDLFGEKDEVWVFDPVTSKKDKIWEHGAYKIYSWSPDNTTLVFTKLVTKITNSGQVNLPTLISYNSTSNKYMESKYESFLDKAFWASATTLAIPYTESTIGSTKLKLDIVDMPGFANPKSYTQTTHALEMYNSSGTFALGYMEPEDTRPFMYDIVQNNLIVVRDLGIDCNKLSFAGWLKEFQFVYACDGSTYYYDINLSKSYRLASIEVGVFKHLIRGATQDNLYYVTNTYNQSSQDYTAQIHKYSIIADKDTVVFEATTRTKDGIKEYSVDRTQTLLAIIESGTAGNNNIIINMNTGTKTYFCDTDYCASPIWMN